MTLTFEQVIHARRTATHDDGWSIVYVDGRYMHAKWEFGDRVGDRVGKIKTPQYGWHHLPDCDCEFCREEAK